MSRQKINPRRILQVLIDHGAVGEPKGLTIRRICHELRLEYCDSTRAAISGSVRHLRRNLSIPVLNNRDGTGYWLSWQISDWQPTLDMLLTFQKGTIETLTALDTARKQIEGSREKVAALLGPPEKR